jgi:beta-glucosidase-like glycosyl hydrolase
MKQYRLFLIILIFVSFIIAFIPNIIPAKKYENIPVTEKPDLIQEKLNSMTLREKIAQMIITSSEGFSYDENSKEYKRLKNLITKEKIGGVIFLKGNAVEEAKLINRLQKLSQTPLLISQDFERGTGMRLDDGSKFPNNMALGATRNSDLAYKMGLILAKECRAIGVGQNYAPVMDVNNNPDNPIINVRSFGEDPLLVSQMGMAVIKGLQEGGIIATAKHFPGHGDTDIDSHSDLPVLNFDRDRLEKLELIPFKNSISAGVKSVMIAHISFPALEKTPFVPASLSENIVTGLLTDELGFNGLKITDALNMEGVTKHFNVSQVAVMCVKAGIDLILMPLDETKSINAIEKAVNSGEISKEKINNSVKRILEAKKWLGLDENKFVNENEVSSIVNSDESKKLSQKIADESITLVENQTGQIPLGRVMTRPPKISLICLNNIDNSSSPDIFSNIFLEKLKTVTSKFDSFLFNGDISGSDAAEVFEKTNDSKIIIIPVFSKVKIKTGTVGIPKSQIMLINNLIKNDKCVIVISFGNPYIIQGFENVDSYICAYGDIESSLNAVTKAMFGEIPIKGKLPVTISKQFKFGDGIIN